MDVVRIEGEHFSLDNSLFSDRREGLDERFELIDRNRTPVSQSRTNGGSFNQALEDEFIYFPISSNVVMTNQATPDSSHADASESPMLFMDSDLQGEWVFNIELFDDMNNGSEHENEMINSINIPVYMSKSFIDPDQMLNDDDDDEQRSSASCVLDSSLSDFDVQEQILIEDKHQGLLQHDDLIPIDKYSEKMQYKLITDITGKDEKNEVLGIVNSVQSSTPIRSEVSTATHKTLIICTREVNGRGCLCSQQHDRAKLSKRKTVRFNLENGKNTVKTAVKDMKSELMGRNTPEHLKRLLLTLAHYGIGKKAVIRSCRSANRNGSKCGCLNSMYTLTRLHLPSKVQNVEATPGNRDLIIEGHKFSLPHGSAVVAVNNEETTYALNSTFDGDVSSLSSMYFDNTILGKEDEDILDNDLFDMSFPIHDVTGLGNISSAIAVEEIETPIIEEAPTDILENNHYNEESSKVKMEGVEENDFEGFENTGEESPHHTITESTPALTESAPALTESASDLTESAPVIEAQDLKSLIEEFEASASDHFKSAIASPNKMKLLQKVTSTPSKSPRIPLVPTTPPFSTIISDSTTSLVPTIASLDTSSSARTTLSVFKTSSVSISPTTPITTATEKTCVGATVSDVELKTPSSVETNKLKEPRKKPALSLIERHNQMKLQQMKTHQKIRAAIPIEIIEKIKASGKRSCTKILVEALNPKLKKRKKSTKLNRQGKAVNSKKKHESHLSVSPKKSKCKKPAAISSDHDYCKSPLKKVIKVEREIPEIPEHVYNKIPEYCQPVVKLEIKKEPGFVEETFKKDSGVDSGHVSDFEAEDRKGVASIMEWQIDRKIKTEPVDEEVVEVEGNVYSRLPDYVTDIGNAKPKIKEEPDDCIVIKEEQDVEEIALESLNAMEEPKRKKKLNLSEYRMRKKNSAENSRCNSPYYIDDKSHASIRHVVTLLDEEEGEIKEENGAKDIPKSGAIKVKPKQQKICRNETKLSHVGQMTKEKLPTKPVKRCHKKPIPEVLKNGVNVIEIDLEKEEAEREREEKIRAKLSFVSQMPSTSLGHCLLYSKKNSLESNEKGSNTSTRKSRCSSSRSHSRSRSRSYSSKGSSRYRKSRGSKRSNHRKSRRRSTRSGSRDRSKSKSSVTSLKSTYSSHSSSRSRSRSLSYSSKSYRSKSRSRSRSKSSRRKYRYKRHSRSRGRSRHRSGSRSSVGWGANWAPAAGYGSPTYNQFYGYSTNGYCSYVPSDYPMCHRSSTEVTREEERRIIYVGGIDDGMTKAELRQRFEKFGNITDISVHFRERGDNYGFITFRHKEDAYDAMEHGNDDPSLPWYNLCFGGRRNFCKEEYSDLDALNAESYYNSASMDYDTLLRTTLQLTR